MQTGAVMGQQAGINPEYFVRDRILVYLKKNKDYGNSFVNSLNKHGIIAYKVRAEDKIQRIVSLLGRKAEVSDESMKDTVLDLFNYTAMVNSWEMKDGSLKGLIGRMEHLIEDGGIYFMDYLMEHHLIDEGEAGIAVEKAIMGILHEELHRTM